MSEPTEHRYNSTACLHGLHVRCRKTCKFCSAPCACPCHGAEHDAGKALVA